MSHCWLAELPGRTLTALIATLAMGVLAQAGWAQIIPHLPETAHDIAALGDDDFLVRQQARQRLLEQGPRAYGWLLRARNSSSHEIARAADRLVRQIDYEPLLAELNPALQGYRQQGFANRAKCVIRLGRSTAARDQTALALIAQFEMDEVLSRCAAIELIENQPLDPAIIEGNLTGSPRTAARWIRAWLDTLEDPAQMQALWQPVIDDILADPQSARCPSTTCRLLRWYAEQLLGRGEYAASDEVSRCQLQFIEHRAAPVIEFMDWLLLHERHAVCHTVVETLGDVVDGDPRLLFRHAELIRLQGDHERARQMAEQSCEMIGAEPLLQLQSAINLQFAGLEHWATLQLQRVIGNEHAAASIRVQACEVLADTLFHRNEFAAAADLLRQAIEMQPASGEAAVTLLQDPHGSRSSRRSYFLHLDALALGDLGAAEQHLLDGIREAPENSDLLIAMSQFRSSSDYWQESTRQLIEIALDNRNRQISQLRVQSERDPRQNRLRQVQLAQELNSFAWLASESGYDLQEAEKYARQAAELAPHNSRILDTLASCLFHRGKYREAVAVQQQAIRNNPNSLQLRAGLNQYRQAMLLAELPGLFR